VTVSQGATTQTYTFEGSIHDYSEHRVVYERDFKGTAATGEDDTADNLEAAIDNKQNDCGYTERRLFSGYFERLLRYRHRARTRL
jgi:hypothetical protein